MIQQCPHPTTVRDCYRTFVSGINPANAIHQGGFARSVGVENDSDLTRIQNKVDPIQSYMAMKSKVNLINVYVHFYSRTSTRLRAKINKFFGFHQNGKMISTKS